MRCRIHNERAILPNDKNSILFESLKRATGNTTEAISLYEQLHSKEFKDWFGDWEINYTPTSFSDENGEPKLVSEFGFHSFKNNKGETWPLIAENKESTSSLIAS